MAGKIQNYRHTEKIEKKKKGLVKDLCTSIRVRKR